MIVCRSVVRGIVLPKSETRMGMRTNEHSGRLATSHDHVILIRQVLDDQGTVNVLHSHPFTNSSTKLYSNAIETATEMIATILQKTQIPRRRKEILP